MQETYMYGELKKIHQDYFKADITKCPAYFKKFDAGKLKYSMFPDSVQKDILKVMAFGASKYGEDNWKSCEEPVRYYNALRRHLDAWREGEYYDPETELPHLAHMLCNAVFMHYIEERKRNDKNQTSVNSSETGPAPAAPGHGVSHGGPKGISRSVWNPDKSQYPGFIH